VRKEANLSYMAAGLPELLCFFVNASGLQIANAEHRVLRSFGYVQAVASVSVTHTPHTKIRLSHL
jgi:hypothetical protein